MGNVLFNWRFYIENNPDLPKAGINTEAKAVRHWTRFGKMEGRVCCPPEPPKYDDLFSESVAEVVAPEVIVDVAEPVAEVVPEPVAEVVESVPEQVPEPVAEVVEPVAESVPEPVPEPVAEVVEPVPKPVAEVVEPVPEPVAESEQEQEVVDEIEEVESELVLDIESGSVETKKPKRSRKKN